MGTECSVAFELSQNFGLGWRGFWRPNFRWFGALHMTLEHIDEAASGFVWHRGRDVISLTRVGESWQVCYQTAGLLVGPRNSVYTATHRTAKFAAWDIMARVINACHDEDQGLEVALRAAQWMRRIDASLDGSRA